MARKDEDLMLDYKAGHTSALEEIFQRYKKRILNYALRLLRNLADAEDVVSETFFIITENKARYEPSAKFSTWLYTVARNLSIDKLRKRKKLTFMWFGKTDSNDYEEMEIVDPRPLADETLEREDKAAYVKRALEKLPLDQREAIILREYQDLRYEEIAQVISCSLSKVKILIFRAREQLRKEILPLIKEASDV